MFFIEIKIAVNNWIKPSEYSSELRAFDQGFSSFEEASFNKRSVKGFFKSNPNLKKLPVRVIQRN
jgi:hypothetical protein